MKQLIDHFISAGYLRTEAVIKAFRKIRREDFVLPEHQAEAQENQAFPIGHGQTISQPQTAVFMLELLNPKEGQKILDIGSGSGWTTALLSQIVGVKGRVVALEIIEELLEMGRKNVSRYNFVKKGIVRFELADGWKGFSEEAPYDRILVSAAAECVPNALKGQLKIGGRMVIPVGNSIWMIGKMGKREFVKEEYPGFIFVPLVEK